MALRVRSVGKVVSVPALGGRRIHRRTEAAPGTGTLRRRREIRGVERLPGRSRHARARGARLVRDCRALRAAQGSRTRLAPGRGPALCRPQAAQTSSGRPRGTRSRTSAMTSTGSSTLRASRPPAWRSRPSSGSGVPAAPAWSAACRRQARSCSRSSSSRSGSGRRCAPRDRMPERGVPPAREEPGRAPQRRRRARLALRPRGLAGRSGCVARRLAPDACRAARARQPAA
jgi:hypothetical protein